MRQHVFTFSASMLTQPHGSLFSIITGAAKLEPSPEVLEIWRTAQVSCWQQHHKTHGTHHPHVVLTSMMLLQAVCFDVDSTL